MDTISWFGTPVTVPLPVTVIRPDVCDAVRVAALAAGVPLDALLPSWVPMVNAPMSSAAAATPVAAARYLGGGALIAMRVLLLRGVLLPSDAAHDRQVPWAAEKHCRTAPTPARPEAFGTAR